MINPNWNENLQRVAYQTLERVREGFGKCLYSGKQGTTFSEGLKHFVNYGCIDQEEAHLATIQGNRARAKPNMFVLENRKSLTPEELKPLRRNLRLLVNGGFIDQGDFHLALCEARNARK